jgi:hypothetical protein
MSSSSFSFRGDCLNQSATLPVSRNLAVSLKFRAYANQHAAYTLRISQRSRGLEATIALGSGRAYNHELLLEHELLPMSEDYSLLVTLEDGGAPIPGRWGFVGDSHRIADDDPRRRVRTMQFEFTPDPSSASRGGVLDLRLYPA